MPRPRRMGRPKLPDSLRLSEIIVAHINKQTYSETELAAKLRGQTLSDYVRAAVVESNRRVGESG